MFAKFRAHLNLKGWVTQLRPLESEMVSCCFVLRGGGRFPCPFEGMYDYEQRVLSQWHLFQPGRVEQKLAAAAA